jgi:histidine ammonia-lyase
MNRLLDGSKLTIDDNVLAVELAKQRVEFDEGEEIGKEKAMRARVPIEDVYSIRCYPQFVGPARELLVQSEDSVHREINSSNDNPLIFVEERAFVHSGNFHGQSMSTAMDVLAAGLNSVGIISDRRVDRFLDEDHSVGLPSCLCQGDKSGIRMGLMGGQLMTSALVAENRTLSLPASIQSIPSTASSHLVS